MNNNLNREFFRYFRYYIIDRIIENCHLTRYDNIDQNKNQSTNINMDNKDTSKKYHTIVASISKRDPDYWYEWIRDAAIVINMMIDLIVSNSVDFIKSTRMMEIIKDYITNNIEIQNLAINKTKIISDGYEFTVTLGEPKFHTNLTVYENRWGRPQNDGPALRAIAMIKLAKYLITRKTDDKTKEKDISYIKRYLYGCDISNVVPEKTLIKRDLEYVVNEWGNRCFDLWEEIEGFHFYTLMMQHHSLVQGVDLALLVGDNKSIDLYKETANKIHTFIMNNFYRDGKIFSSIGIINQKIKERYIDLSVLLAFIHTSTPYNEELLNVMVDTVMAFIDKYTVNKHKSLYLMGRYLDDTYYGGNPWVLTTAALAYMLMTIDIRKLNTTKLNDKFYQIFGLKNDTFKKLGIKIIKDLITIEDQNEDIMMSFAEQIDKRTLIYKSADRLTWNYVELLRTLSQIQIQIHIHE